MLLFLCTTEYEEMRESFSLRDLGNNTHEPHIDEGEKCPKNHRTYTPHDPPSFSRNNPFDSFTPHTTQRQRAPRSIRAHQGNTFLKPAFKRSERRLEVAKEP